MAQAPPVLEINPPLVNSSNPWATTLEDLRALYDCRATGAVTTRTSLLRGFNHDPARHSYVFFDPANHKASEERNPRQAEPTQNASLNSLGYSPYTLETYLGFIKTISSEQQALRSPSSPQLNKGFIVSVTGSPTEVADSYRLIATAGKREGIALPLAVEVNLSCPNITGAPPPAYSGDALRVYLEALGRVADGMADDQGEGEVRQGLPSLPRLPRLPFGLKTPPYTHTTQYQTLVDVLAQSASNSPGGACPVSFITATNTLGSCLVFETPSGDGAAAFALPGPTGVGGMAGAPLHPLALGNVATLRQMLDRHRELRHICIVGTGGVSDAAGYRRMRAVGASAVGVGTALGIRGVGVFGEIENGLGGKW